MKENIAEQYPSLIEEWNAEKNTGISLKDITKNSTERVWWKCEKGHEYRMTPYLKIVKKKSCPYCAIADELKAHRHPNQSFIHPTAPKSSPPSSYSRVYQYKTCKKGHEYKIREGSEDICPICLGIKLKEFRKILNISGRDIANEIGISYQAIYDTELGRYTKKEYYDWCKERGFDFKTFNIKEKDLKQYQTDIVDYCIKTRKEKNLSQMELARQIGCTFSTVNRFENYKTFSWKIAVWFLANGKDEKELIQKCIDTRIKLKLTPNQLAKSIGCKPQLVKKFEKEYRFSPKIIKWFLENGFLQYKEVNNNKTVKECNTILN